MKRIWSHVVVPALTAALLVQPVSAIGRPAAGELRDPPASVVAPGPGPETAPAADRAAIAAQLIALDHEPAEARGLAAELTEADLAVLLAHPQMMQRADGLTPSGEAMLIGGLIVAGIILLASSSNSSGFISVN